MIVTEAIYEVQESHNCAWTFETHFIIPPGINRYESKTLKTANFFALVQKSSIRIPIRFFAVDLQHEFFRVVSQSEVVRQIVHLFVLSSSVETKQEFLFRSNTNIRWEKNVEY